MFGSLCSACWRWSAIISTGGFMAGPRALRPERLQWLTTSADNRQAVLSGASAPEQCGVWRRHHCDARRQKDAGRGHRTHWSSGRSAIWPINAAFLKAVVVQRSFPIPVIPAQAGICVFPNRDARFRGHDRRKGEFWTSTTVPIRALAHIFLEISIRAEAWTEPYPPSFFTTGKAGPALR
jgi:hypothetical protein